MAEHEFVTGDLVRYVNPRQGSGSHFRFSRGNCFPLVARPFGMTHWCPQTDEDNWYFRPENLQLQGVRATHQPSPWIGDYGHFAIMAQTGRPLLSAGSRSSAYRAEELEIQPHYLKVNLRRYSTTLEMTPTERCSLFRFTFPEGERRRVIFDPLAGESHVEVDAALQCFTGFTRGSTGGVTDNFACYFAAVFSQPFDEAAPVRNGRAVEGSPSLTGERVGAMAEFSVGADPVLEMRIGTSFISVDQALQNLELEVGSRTFEEVRTEGEAIWNRALAAITVAGAADEQLRTFYSCLYRAHLFPRMWHETDASGKRVHFSPYDGHVHEGVLYTDNGFWDTYRTVYPLLSILAPDRLGEIIEGWVQAYREGGWFPQWASPGYRACMVGTHIDAVIADAAVKNIQGFDMAKAFEGMLKHAAIPGDEAGSYGRIGIEDHLRLGFVPADRFHGAVARSLDYAYDDFCISQVAAVLGRGNEREAFRKRAMAYRNLYDPSVGFMRARNADGSWQEPFEEFTWGGPYVEGGAWQSTWAVQHDPAGLIQLMGGAGSFVEKLEKMLCQEPRFEVGTYGFEIHEMTEMAAVPFGQYAHSNQPVHHALMLFAAAGRPEKMQHWVRKVMAELYSPDGFAGDEDNGEMSCWYILNALGIYPLCPGHPTYVLGSPLFAAARVALPGGNTLTIEVERDSPDDVYIRRVVCNGQPHDRLWISHQDLMRGCHLKFIAGKSPGGPAPRILPESLPYSLSTEPPIRSG